MALVALKRMGELERTRVGVRLRPEHTWHTGLPYWRSDLTERFAGVGARSRAFQRRELLPPRQVLQYQFPIAAERQRQRTADHNQQLQHASIVAGRR